MTLRRLILAEYIWQPAQLARRAWRVARRVHRQERAVIRLPWNFPLAVDPRECIGRSIVALNSLDLPVTETIWRLLDPGERAVDVGANIGYMTSVMAARLRAGGSVVAFEPLPELADALRANVRSWSGLSRATIDIRQQAVGAHAGPARLHVPASFAANRGEATLAPVHAAAIASIETVDCARLDDALPGDRPIAVMKVDVEGFEPEVLHGAAARLRARSIRDIVLEEYGPADAPSLELLRSHGFSVSRIARRWNGPRLVPAAGPCPGEIDPPTYLATLDPARAQARFAPRGWFALRRPRATRSGSKQ